MSKSSDFDAIDIGALVQEDATSQAPAASASHFSSKLSTTTFSDLILGSSDFSKPSFFKGVSHSDRIRPVPKEFEDDLKGIWELCEANSLSEFSIAFDGLTYRVSRIETVNGQYYMLRRGIERIPSLIELGLSSQVVQKLMSLPKRGVLLFCGSTGAGKTTSASSFVSTWLQKYGGHAMTLEDPPELSLHGAHGDGFCLQTSMHSSEYGEGLVKLLRCAAPDLIFLGELRTPSSVSQALRAGSNGHLIVSTTHGSDVIKCLQKLLALGKEHDPTSAAELLAGGLVGVVYQELRSKQGKTRLMHQVLWPGDEESDPIRSLLRRGEIIQLGTMLQRQNSLM